MISHVMIEVADVERSLSFFEPVLATLSAAPFMKVRDADDGPLTTVGMRDTSGPFFWFKSARGTPGYYHVAFAADTREQVQAFHAAGLAAGGRDNGAPGPRPQYSPDYYAAFILDLDGNNIEATCRVPVD